MRPQRHMARGVQEMNIHDHTLTNTFNIGMLVGGYKARKLLKTGSVLICFRQAESAQKRSIYGPRRPLHLLKVLGPPVLGVCTIDNSSTLRQPAIPLVAIGLTRARLATPNCSALYNTYTGINHNLFTRI